MKAMIFAAGLGTRLKPLTDHCPKALVKVGGSCLLERCILNLISFGVDEIVINIHYFGEQIIQFVEEKHFDVPVLISDERQQLLDTGGGLKHAQHFFAGNEPFFVHNVDIISNINLTELYNAHQQSRAIATLAVRDRQTSRYLLVNENNELCGRVNLKNNQETIVQNKFTENNKRLAFSGIQVVSPEIFRYMPATDVFSIVDLYLQLAEKKKVSTFQHQYGFWMDMGKIEDIALLEQKLKDWQQ